MYSQSCDRVIPNRVIRAIMHLVVLVVMPAAHALNIETVMIEPAELGAQCKSVNGEFAVSMQASTHYSMAKDKALLGAPPEKTMYQSFDCRGRKSTIYYYQYRTKKDRKRAQAFAKGLIWGGDGPSRLHPELILAKDNVLIVISSKDPKTFKQRLRLSSK